MQQPAEERCVVFHRAGEGWDPLDIKHRPARPRRALAPVAPAAASPAWADESVAFARSVLHRAGYPSEVYRDAPLARRIRACLRALRCRTTDEARAAIERDPAALQAAVETLLLGVTWFNRDERVFDALRDRLVQRSGAAARPWRIWSAGCSDGSELYGLAMLLHDLGQLEGAVLLGTDVRSPALDRARRGVYCEDRVSRLPEAWRRRYLTPRGAGYSVVDDIRRAAHWRRADATVASPAHEAWDVILCRNLAIYLRPDAEAALWRNLTERLAPGGLLVCGKAERPERFAPVRRVAPCLYEPCLSGRTTP